MLWVSLPGYVTDNLLIDELRFGAVIDETAFENILKRCFYGF